MAETTSTFTGPVTEEALIEERQRFWQGFTTATVFSVIIVALILILMAIFLV
jgi:hypothetical protein